MKKINLYLLFSLAFVVQSFAQKEHFAPHEIGFTISISFINEKMPEGYYQPILLKGFWAWHLGETNNISEKSGHFLYYLEPQINPVFISGKLRDIEFGCNFGFRYDLEMGENNRMYWGIGTGPHYITVNTDMQHRGYIFSDNFVMGSQQRLFGPIFSNVQYHFRHISNAGFMKPNKGIDNHFITLGVSELIEY